LTFGFFKSGYLVTNTVPTFKNSITLCFLRIIYILGGEEWGESNPEVSRPKIKRSNKNGGSGKMGTKCPMGPISPSALFG
jgi:hypothetical protein